MLWNLWISRFDVLISMFLDFAIFRPLGYWDVVKKDCFVGLLFFNFCAFGPLEDQYNSEERHRQADFEKRLYDGSE